MNTILIWTIFTQVWAVPACPKEQAALKSLQQQLEKSAAAVSDLAKQSQSLDQRIREYQQGCAGKTGAKCNPAEMQMMAGQSAVINGQKTKSTEAFAKLKEQEQAAKLALAKCMKH